MCSGWWKGPSALSDGTAPSAFVDRKPAQAAPTDPERRVRRLEACRGPRSSPRAAPALKGFHFDHQVHRQKAEGEKLRAEVVARAEAAAEAAARVDATAAEAAARVEASLAAVEKLRAEGARLRAEADEKQREIERVTARAEAAEAARAEAAAVAAEAVAASSAETVRLRGGDGDTCQPATSEDGAPSASLGHLTGLGPAYAHPGARLSLRHC